MMVSGPGVACPNAAVYGVVAVIEALGLEWPSCAGYHLIKRHRARLASAVRIIRIGRSAVTPRRRML